METVSLEQVGHEELVLPPRVQEALGQLVGSAKEGLLALERRRRARRAGRADGRGSRRGRRRRRASTIRSARRCGTGTRRAR